MKLREMLIRTNMEDMREKTHMRHYELYRKKRLEQVMYECVFNEIQGVPVNWVILKLSWTVNAFI